MAVSILIADDHQVLRDGLSSVLDAEPDMDVVAEAADGLEAVRSVEELKPDVLVLDLRMPGLPGLDVMESVGARSPETKIVVLSMHADHSYILRSLRSGAVAYVVKSAGAEELKKAIRVAVAGGRYVTPPFPEAFIEGPPARTDQEPTDPHETLTLREREVLYLVAEGLSNRQIADRLEISSRTVEAHRARLMTKLRLDSQAALIRYALERTDRLNP